MSWAIQTKALTKRFPAQTGWRGLLSADPLGHPAVNQVDLSVPAGEIFGLVGPNGAGKTTLIKLLCTLIVPTNGTATVNGYALQNQLAIKRTIGVVASDERSFYWRLTGRQNLAYFAALHGLPPNHARRRIAEVVESLGLEEVADQRFATYATGMRQRLSIARALLHHPKLLFLDEPTQGLDPGATHKLHTLIKEELTRRERMTIFLTTHRLAEAEALCDQLAILHQGQIQACGSLADLKSLFHLGAQYRLLVANFNPDLAAQLGKLGAHYHREVEKPGLVELMINAPDGATLDSALEAIQAQGGRIRALHQAPDSLETIFNHLTGDVAHFGLTRDSTDDHLLIMEGEHDPGPNPAEGEQQPEVQYRSRAPGGGVPSLRILQATLLRDLRHELSYPLAFTLQFLSVFFSVAVFYFLSQLLEEGASKVLAPYGGDYFSFVLIGIAFAGYFGVGLSSFADSLRQAQTTGTLEAMLTTPADVSSLILSASAWSYLLTTLRVLVYLAVGVLVLGVDLGGGNYPAALVVLVLTLLAFSSLGIIAASFIMVLKRGNPVTWAFGALSTLLGGVYYPVEVLPGWLQAISYLFPVTYALRGMRLALLRGASFPALMPDILALASFCVVLLPLSLVAFRWAVRRARVDGSLTHY